MNVLDKVPALEGASQAFQGNQYGPHIDGLEKEYLEKRASQIVLEAPGPWAYKVPAYRVPWAFSKYLPIEYPFKHRFKDFRRQALNRLIKYLPSAILRALKRLLNKVPGVLIRLFSG